MVGTEGQKFRHFCDQGNPVKTLLLLPAEMASNNAAPDQHFPPVPGKHLSAKSSPAAS
jgi:hypothetical protein